MCQRFAKRVIQALRRQAKLEHALATSSTLHPGMVIVVRRFRSGLGLFVHLHTLVTDGCFEDPDDCAQEVRFWPTEQLAGDHLLSALLRLHADLAESALDEGEPPEDGVAEVGRWSTSGALYGRCGCPPADPLASEGSRTLAGP